MPQHQKVTKAKVEGFLGFARNANRQNALDYSEDLLRLLPTIDAFLVKHDRTDLARLLRKAFDKLQEGA